MRAIPVLLASLLFVALVPLSVGCGPYLQYELRAERHFQATRPCAQGPFEIEVTPLEARLGESYSLHACTPRDLVGRYRVSAADGQTLEEGRFSTTRARGFDRDTGQSVTSTIDGPDNARCLVELEEVSAPMEPAVEVAPPSSWAPSPPPPAPSAWPEPAPPIDLPPFAEPAPSEEPETMEAARLVEVAPRELACPSSSLGRIHIASRSYEVRHSTYDSGAPNAPFRIVLWSDAPNDLEGVTFVLEQRAAVSSEGGDEGYLAHLREREDEERRRAEEEDRRRRERDAHCAAHHEDIFCWGLGGYEGHVARLEERRRRAEHRSRLARERASLGPSASAPSTPVCVEPGIPPVADDELAPPRPTPNAEWVPGYFTFQCVEWVWSSGFWRVPESDLADERLLIAAPMPPPPPRVEVPPVIVSVEVIWTPGYWVWDRGRFVWIEGSYRKRPRPGVRWRAGEWRRDGEVVRFVPGRWE